MKNRCRFLVIAASLAALLLPTASLAEADAASPSPEPWVFNPASVVVEPVRPYQPGDQVWFTSPPVTQIDTAALASGCQRVPSTGYIGTNVYAASSSHYSNYWSWGSASSGQPFYWYVKRNDETNADNGYSSGGGGSSRVAANTYHWKVQNKGSTPQAWNVCWDLL